MTGQKSGYYYPNRMARIFVMAMEEIMGKNGLNAILNMAKLPALIDSYPPDNLDKQFDFADFSALNQALEEMYGTRGGRGLALRAGRATWARGLQGLGALSGVGDMAFKVLPLSVKLKLGLPGFAGVFNQISDQVVRIEEQPDHIVWHIERCPVCWGRKSEKPCCYVATGLLQESLRWVSSGKEFRVDEVACIAAGDPACSFWVYKDPVG
jgi:predicted hydrocarbon binding protein